MCNSCRPSSLSDSLTNRGPCDFQVPGLFLTRSVARRPNVNVGRGGRSGRQQMVDRRRPMQLHVTCFDLPDDVSAPDVPVAPPDLRPPQLAAHTSASPRSECGCPCPVARAAPRRPVKRALDQCAIAGKVRDDYSERVRRARAGPSFVVVNRTRLAAIPTQQGLHG